MRAEICICAAVRLADGLIFRGHRHSDCLRTAYKTIEFLEPCTWNDRRQGLEQGFITSTNRFVGRKEGLLLQLSAGISSAAPDGYRNGGQLFSEDLY